MFNGYVCSGREHVLDLTPDVIAIAPARFGLYLIQTLC